MYSPQFVPPLVQTAAYACAALPLEGPRFTETGVLDRALRIRLIRQQILTRRAVPLQRLWTVLDEAALRRPVSANADVMTEQIEHLLDVAAEPNVTLQVLPLITPNPAAGGALTLLSFRDASIPDVLHTMEITGPALVDRPDVVERGRLFLDALSCASLSPADSMDFLRDMLGRSAAAVPIPRLARAPGVP